MSREVGHTPRGNRVTLERESRVEGPGPHVFVYDKEGRRYRVGVPSGTTAEQVADDLVSGRTTDRSLDYWIRRNAKPACGKGGGSCKIVGDRHRLVDRLNTIF